MDIVRIVVQFQNKTSVQQTVLSVGDQQVNLKRGVPKKEGIETGLKKTNRWEQIENNDVPVEM